MSHSPQPVDRERYGARTSDAFHNIIIDRFDALLIALVLAGFWCVAAAPLGPKPFGDGYFHREAKLLAAALKDFDLSSVAPFSHAPGPSLYYTVPYLFVATGAEESAFWLAAVVWNCCAMCLAVLLIRRAAEKLSGQIAGRVSVALAFACPMFLYYGTGIWSETPAYLASVTVALGWAKLRAEPACLSYVRRSCFLVFAGLLGLILSRPNAVLVLPLVLLLVSMAAIRGDHRPAVWASLYTVLAVAMVLAVIVSAIAYWNYKQGRVSQHRFVTRVMVQGAFQFRSEPWDWRHWSNESRADSRDYMRYAATTAQLQGHSMRTGIPLAEVEAQWLAHSILTEPAVWIKMGFLRILASHVFIVNSQKPSQFHFFFFRGLTGYFIFHALLNLAYLVMIVSSIAFIVRSRGEVGLYWGLWAPWLSLAIFTAVTYSEPRYVFPAQGSLAVMSSAVLGPILERRAARLTQVLNRI